jgi:outer membrane receptor protein involved in Fe transport
MAGCVDMSSAIPAIRIRCGRANRWTRSLEVSCSSRRTLHRADKGKGADEGVSLTVGLDAFNIFNRTNFTTYVGTVDSPLFGRAIAAQPPRRTQLSLRAKF